jgi:hypothetical protein
MSWRTTWAPVAAAIGLATALPAVWFTQAMVLGRDGPRAFGKGGADLVSHLWAMWNASQGPATRSRLLTWPEEVDLLPVLPGWLDVVFGGLLTPAMGLVPAYDLVQALYLVLAGLGATALARAAGFSWPAALVAGLLMQLDGYVLDHLKEGRPEQVGVGVVSLALAGAVQLWRNEAGRGAAIATGLAAVLTVAISWELAVMTALIGLWLLPWLPRSTRAPTAWRRLALAAATATVLLGPPVVLFLARASAARPPDESSFSLPLAAAMSVPALGWFGWGSIRPGWVALVALPLAALLGKPESRRLHLGIAIGLGLTLLLATGPTPRLWGPAAATPTPWAPFLLLQKLPLMGWFHWPDRPLLAWSVAAPVAAAAVIDAARRLPHKLASLAALLLAALFVGDAVVETRQTRRWPDARYSLPASGGMVWLGRDPHPGAVLDLPWQGRGNFTVDYTANQLVHGRPIHFGLLPERLTGVDQSAFIAQVPLLLWIEAAEGGAVAAAPALSEGELAWLSAQGFGWLNLRGPGVDPQLAAQLAQSVEAALGPPVRDEPPFVRLYRIPISAP